MTPVQKARARLLLRSPFYGTLLMTTPIIERTDIPTAATDMKAIYYNPAFFEKLTVEEIIFVLAHEVMHMVLLHGIRRGDRHPERWNQACDYAINWTLAENGLHMPSGENAGLLDRAFAGMTAEAIYDKLRDDNDKKGGGSLAGDLLDPKMSSTEQAAAEQTIRSRVVQAVTASRLAGTVPEGIEKTLSGMLDPQVNWREALRAFVTRVVKNRVTWDRRNRRFPTLVLPTRHGKEMGKIGVILDVSGSITTKVQEALLGEVNSIVVDVGVKEVQVKYATTITVLDRTYEGGQPIPLEKVPSGGTDMCVPLAEFETEAEPPEVVVLLTDGYTPWPSVPPTYPLIVCCTTDVAIPIGAEVRINA